MMNRYLYLAAGLALLPSTADAVNRQKQQPNVIVVLTDDQGYGDLSYTGNPVLRTPHIDAFAQDALRLTNYHVGTTSTPSRSGLMTGRNCLRSGTWHTIIGCNLMSGDEKTFADYFTEAGYVTGLFGKWGLGDTYDLCPDSRGFQEVVCPKGGGIGQTPGYWNNDYSDPVLFHNRRPKKYEGYCTDIFFEESIKFIRRNRKHPFLCYLSLNAAHAPFNVPLEYYNMYKDESVLTEDQKRFYGMITNIDDNFAILVDVLRECGIEDNTILIFTTDNGSCRGYTHYNAGMRGRKGSEYDGGHRVPFFMRWPAGGFSEGRDYDGLVAHVDFLPTITSLAGIEVRSEKKLDGVDVSSYLRNGEEVERMLVTDVQRNTWPEKGRKSCVMKSHWRWVNGKELYNVENDPGQECNVCSEYPELARQMEAFYDEWWADASQEFKYTSIVVEPDHATELTCQDIHTEDVPAWNQEFVRLGRLSRPGFYPLTIKESGEYRIVLSRWPEESGLAMSDPFYVEHQNVPNWDDRSDGKSLKFSSAYVEIDGKRHEAAVDNSSRNVTFTVQFEAGETRLKTVLVLENGKETNAFYVKISKSRR